jgi:hypothetical protein
MWFWIGVAAKDVPKNDPSARNLIASFKDHTRQAMHVKRNIEARPQIHWWPKKAISLTYFCVCVCVWVRMCDCSLTNPHATRGHITICGLSGSTSFVDIISKRALFWEKNVIEHKMCFDFLHNFAFLTLKRIQRYIFVNVKTPSCKVHVILVGF